MRRPFGSTSPPPLLLVGVLALGAAGCWKVAGADEEFRPADAPPVVVAPEAVARQQISARDADRHIAFLADDARGGRGTPSPGLERAAAWIAEAFQRAGLEPAGSRSGYLQYWPCGDDSTLVANVVGLLPGSDLTRAGEPVIMVAHYDHLGVGPPDADGDSVYNGADDNASGVAALVEIAQAFGALPDRPPRPVVFLAVAGHEEGLLGSSWFVAHPTVDLESATAVIDLHRVGRNHPDSIRVVGYDASTLGALVAEVAATIPAADGPLAVVPAPRPVGSGGSTPAHAELPSRSDHLPFARAGIPAIEITSGLHGDVATPSDEADRVDDRKVARVATLVFLVAHRIASDDGRPERTAEAEPGG